MSVIEVRVLSGPESGTVVRGDKRVTIGSASYCNLRLTARGIMAVHAEVNATPRGLQVRSFSRTGTMLNGAQVTDSLLSPEDELELGEGTRVQVRSVNSQAQAIPEPPRPAAARRPPAPASPASGPTNSFLATLWRYRIIGVIYLVLLLAAGAYFAEDASLASQYETAAKSFAAEQTRLGVTPAVLSERWRGVEKAYSLERAGQRDAAMAEYLRVMTAEMGTGDASTTRSTAWKFAATRLAALRGGRRAGL